MKRIDTTNPTFENYIDYDAIYVDKTDILYNLVKLSGGYFFCSRPRCFGKTMVLSTLEAIFQGKKELFKGLKIYDTDYDWKEYPIIHLNLSLLMCASSREELELMLNEEVFNAAQKHGAPFDRSYDCYMNLDCLISYLGKKSEVVVLIDEYDKMLLSGLNKPEIEEMRSALWGFFEILKANGEYIRFLLIEGVTRFTQISVFSSINNLYDISLDKRYSALFGYTEEEVKHYFSEYIEEGMKKTGLSYDEYMNKLRKNYGGYRFSPDSEVDVYNPVSIGLFFSKGGEHFDNYWIETGGMQVLMDVTKKVSSKIANDVARIIDRQNITTFDILAMAANSIGSAKYRSLLFQTGYLTIKGIDEDCSNLLILDFPNEEVAEAYTERLLPMCLKENEA